MITEKYFYDYRQLEYALYGHFGEKISLKNEPSFTDSRWPMWLAADIEDLSTRHGFETVKNAAQHFISTGSLNVDRIDWENIEMAIKVRSDWPAALESAKDGYDLSWRINFGFFGKDLLELMRLHKENRFREKIEELLYYCNYHSLSSYLSQEDYDAAVKWVEQEVIFL